MTVGSLTESHIICHCIGVTKADVEESLRLHGCSRVKEIIEQTGAGSGCTACRRRLAELIRRHEHARQPSASSSPI